MSSLFEQIGGSAAVDAAVDVFYGHVLADTWISHFFEGLDMQRMARHQKAFLTVAFGGPNHYSGRGLGNAHARLVEQGLNDSHFDAVAENLARTLHELNVPQDLVDQVLEVAGSTREAVLGRA